MDPGFRAAGGLGARKKFTNFTNVAEWSNASNVSKYWLGSGVHLGALKALAYIIVKYAFSHFLVHFLYKRLYSNGQTRDLKYSLELVCRYITLYKTGIWDPLRAPEAVAFYNLSSYFC